MSEDIDEIIGDLCPFCKQVFDDEDHDTKQCTQASYRMIIDANSKLEEYANRHGRLRVEEEDTPHTTFWRRLNRLRYELEGWARIPHDFIRMVLYFYLILALIRFIEIGLN